MSVLLTATVLYILFVFYAWNKQRQEKKVRMQEVAIRKQRQQRHDYNQW